MMVTAARLNDTLQRFARECGLDEESVSWFVREALLLFEKHAEKESVEPMETPLVCECLDRTKVKRPPREHDANCPVRRRASMKARQDPRRQHEGEGPAGGREVKPL